MGSGASIGLMAMSSLREKGHPLVDDRGQSFRQWQAERGVMKSSNGLRISTLQDLLSGKGPLQRKTRLPSPAFERPPLASAGAKIA
jgi:uracil-DNA glycosylase